MWEFVVVEVEYGDYVEWDCVLWNYVVEGDFVK